MREGLPIPDRIRDAPSLYMGLELYYLAFVELMTSRNIGMAEGAIPWAVVDNWARREDLDEEQRADLHYFVSVLDSAYLAHKDRKRKAEAELEKSTRKRGNG